ALGRAPEHTAGGARVPPSPPADRSSPEATSPDERRSPGPRGPDRNTRAPEGTRGRRSHRGTASCPRFETRSRSMRRPNRGATSRHHLVKRASASALAQVAGDMAGVQAQVLSAAQISLWARTRGLSADDVENALWRDRTLVK